MLFFVSLQILHGCVRLTTQICRTLTSLYRSNFENTAPTNQNKKVKIKERRADWSDTVLQFHFLADTARSSEHICTRSHYLQ